MKYNINIKSFRMHFDIPSVLIDKYLKLASGEFIKVILLLLSLNEDNVTSEYIHEKTGIDLKICEDAVDYWIDEGILTSSNASENTDNITNTKQSIETTSENNEPKKSIIEAVNPAKNANKKIMVRYTPSQIAELCKSNDDIHILMDNIQSVLSKEINYTEQLTLINLYEYYGFSVGVILMLIAYCQKIGKTKIAYAETIAKSWFEKGIDTHEAAELEIIKMEKQNTLEIKIMNAFGLKQNLTPKQKEYINTWFSYGYDLETITYAYEKCVDGTNTLSFPYINKIINTWNEKGYKTKNDIKAYDEKPKKEEQQEDQQPSYDLDDFYKIALNHTPSFKGE